MEMIKILIEKESRGGHCKNSQGMHGLTLSRTEGREHYSTTAGTCALRRFVRQFPDSVIEIIEHHICF